MDWHLPELGEDIESATLIRLLVQVGDEVQPNQAVLEMETDKVTVEVPITMGGTITAAHVQAGDKIVVGAPIFSIEGDAQAIETPPASPVAPPPVQTSPTPPPPAPQTASHFAGVRAAPAVRRLARELGLDVENIPGSGPEGQCLLDDVKEFARNAIQGSSTKRSRQIDFEQWGEITREAMSPTRQKTAERMATAWRTIPHVTHFDDADITALEKWRKAQNTKKTGPEKLTITAILIEAMVEALKTFPQFNASLDMDTEEIILKQYFNIGVAVDTEQGLVVPVLKNVDQMDLWTIVAQLSALAQKARDRKLTLGDVQGANITVTNLGGIGGTNFTPIINPPEVAILAVSRSRLVGKQLIAPLGLSYDHRLIDGADAARFVRFIVERIESHS